MRFLSIGLTIFCAVFMTAPLHAKPLGFIDALKQPISGLLISAVSQQIGGKIESRKIAFSAPSTLILHGFRFQSDDGGLKINAERLVIQLSIGALLLGQIQVSAVNANRPHVTITPVPTDPSQTSDSESSNSIQIDSVQVHDGKLVWHRENSDPMVLSKVQGSAMYSLKRIDLHYLRGDYNGSPFSLGFNYLSSREGTRYKAIRGMLASGAFTGDIAMGPGESSTSLDGFIDWKGVSLEQLPAAFRPPGFKGKANAHIQFSQTTQDPSYNLSADAPSLEASGVAVTKLELKGAYAKNRWTTRRFHAHLLEGEISATQMIWGDDEVKGHIQLKNLEMGAIPALSSQGLRGRGVGQIDLSGNSSALEIQGRLKFPQIFLKGVALGNVTLSLKQSAKKPDVLLADADLKTKKGNAFAHAILDLKHKQVEAYAKTKGIDLEPLTQKSTLFVPLKGLIVAEIKLKGPFATPALNLDVHTLGLRSSNANKKAGDVYLKASLAKGRFRASIKGLEETGSLAATIEGPMRSFDNFDLKALGTLDLAKIENWLRHLHDESISSDVRVKIVAGRLQKSPNGSLKTSGQASVEQFRFTLLQAPEITLKKPVLVRFDNDSIALFEPALFTFSDGELSLNGSAKRGNLALMFKGRLPLHLAKYFTSSIRSAKGSVDGEFVFNQSQKSRTIRAYLEPNPDSSITPNAYLDEIVFKKGTVRLQNNPKNPRELDLTIDGLKMAIGDGEAMLEGKMQWPAVNWDLHFRGDSLTVRQGNDWIEGDFDLDLKSQRSQNEMRGSVKISDGYYFKKFSMSQFTLSSSSSPLLRLPKWLQDTRFDIQILAQSFHAEAEMSTFWLDSYLSADLKLIGKGSFPRLVGAVDIADGALKFPTLTFEIPSTTIPFKDTPNRHVDPQIQLYAFADLPQKRFNLSEDTTVELSLIGNLDQLHMDLKPIYGDKRLDRTKLLLALAGSSKAGLEFVENSLSTFTNTRFRINSAIQTEGVATQIQWQLNPRLEIEGTTATSTQDVNVQDIKLKFMIFDHLPFGKQLFFESTFLSPSESNENENRGEKLKLKFRVVDQ